LDVKWGTFSSTKQNLWWRDIHWAWNQLIVLKHLTSTHLALSERYKNSV